MKIEHVHSTYLHEGSVMVSHNGGDRIWAQIENADFENIKKIKKLILGWSTHEVDSPVA